MMDFDFNTYSSIIIYDRNLNIVVKITQDTIELFNDASFEVVATGEEA